MKSPHTSRRLLVAFGAILTAAAIGGACSVPADAAAPTGPIRMSGSPHAVPNSYIVVLKDSASSDSAPTDSASTTAVSGRARRLAASYGGSVARVYSTALRGFEAS